MPTYVYECSSCQDTYEVEQRISEDALKDCRCGSKGTVKRLIQPVGVMFKGSGFHINDYAAKAAPSEATAETKTEAKTDAPVCSGEPKSCPACSTEPAS
jgi:putative FmdB family regulatory protein